MNRKQFITLLVLVALLGTAGWIIRKHNQESWQSSGQNMGDKLLPNFPLNDVAQIIIQSGTNTLNLARSNNIWVVQERNNYPANFSQISDLLIKLGDLKIAQSQPAGPSQLGRFALLPPGPDTNTATSIAFKDQGGKSLGSLLLGKKLASRPDANAQFGLGGSDGRYVMTGSGGTTVATISDTLDGVEVKPESWLKKDFISLENPVTVSAEFPETTNSWKLTHDSGTNGWVLADAKPDEKADATKTSGVTSFGSLSFNDVLPADAKPEISGLTNVTTLTVETADHFTYTLKIGSLRDDTYPVNFTVTADLPKSRPAAKDEKPEDKAKLDQAFTDQQKTLTDKLAKAKEFSQWIYQVPSYSLSSILKPRAQLMVEPTKPANATSSTPDAKDTP